MVGPIQAHLSWVGRAPHSLGRMAGAGAMPRGPEMGSYGRLIWVNYNDLTATEP